MSKTTTMTDVDTRLIRRCASGYDWNTFNDSEYLYFGSDNDVSISYNGTTNVLGWTVGAGGISITVAALTVGDAYTGIRCAVTTAAANNSYGTAGYFDTTVTGTQAGSFVYGLGSWVTASATFAISGDKKLCAQDNGIYTDASATLSAVSQLIFGLRAEAIIGGSLSSELYPFSINSTNPITALFAVEDEARMGIVTGKTTGERYLPIYQMQNGQTAYVLLYF